MAWPSRKSTGGSDVGVKTSVNRPSLTVKQVDAVLVENFPVTPFE